MGTIMFGKKIDQWLTNATFGILYKKAKLRRNEIQIEGHRIVYLENSRQNKKSIILIHGNNDDKNVWLMLSDALSEHYHLIIIDLLGCGESDLVEDFDYSLPSQASFLQKTIIHILQEKKIEHFVFMAHSMGGFAVLLANTLPVEKFILIDTMGAYVTASKWELEFQNIPIDHLPFLNISSREELKALLPKIYRKVPYMPNFILDTMIEKKKVLMDFEKQKFHYLVDEKLQPVDDLTETLKNIRQETLIVWGKEDLIIDVASAYKMHELIMNSTLKVYKACGHYPQVEMPKRLAKDIVEFLK